MGLLTRRPDWPLRLVAVFESARREPYVLGTHDCLRVACAAIEATTGTDFWPRFVGYKTHRQALATIARIAPSLGEAVTATLGIAPTPVIGAQRGDIALFRDDEGKDHLGVVMGALVVVTAPDGLRSMGLDHPGLICGWRIG